MADTAGGNISDVTCGSNSLYNEFMTNYNLLSNCSELVSDKCNISVVDSVESVAMEKCNVEMEKAKGITADCQKLSTDRSAQCACWLAAKTDHMDKIKGFQPKCTGMSKIAKAMKKEKNACLDQFIKCKKAE